MAPSPQQDMVNQHHQTIPSTLTGEECVISGISGVFPMSASVLEFKENLYNGEDMVTTENDRWELDHPEIPKHFGFINGVDHFDAQFFKVHYKQATLLDPMTRILLEHAYSAIFDAGVNPIELRGRKIGVFIGAATSDAEKVITFQPSYNGFSITGCNKAMNANRISYWLDSKGPSYCLDAACSSFMVCLEHAYESINSGACEAAIVGGCNLCMHPCVALNLGKYGLLCLDGKTKCFDEHGDGYVRSDAISVLFLQKAKDAKRIYSEVYHVKSSFSRNMEDRFLPVRQPQEIQKFMEDFYEETGVSPRDVEYLEANASAIAEADDNELEAIGKVFAKDKTIQIGCVKSNMGNGEAASGACSLVKICLAYQTGVIPANLHFSEPHDNIPAVREGRIQVVTENRPFNRGFTALNSFSFSGINSHALMKGHYKPKDLGRYRSSIPYIVLASGRQDQCVKSMFDKLNKQPVDAEQIGLLHEIHEKPITGHTCRGYTILDTNDNNETKCLDQAVEFIEALTRPVWFLYSGMGSQWATMGAQLMRIPIFAAAIEKCQRALEPKGIDIVNILTNPDKTIYKNILHSFVGIAAVQIGLTDVLRELGIVPDNIIGHSVGELGCAYADGCLTAEEMILSAYSRGLVSLETPVIRGSMAAVGLGFKAIKNLCPPEVEVACHNSADSCTISGPADVMKNFVQELKARSIFATEVACSNIAYHSRYIQNAGPGLLKYLREVIKNPKQRSKKWMSTSVPQDRWDEAGAQYSSAEYHTNNLLNAVLFEETSKLIPSNAIVIEIAPHGLLQAIVTRSLPDCTHIPLTRRGHEDPVKFLLQAVGKLYLVGQIPEVKALYPRIQFPVATETSLLSHLVEWEHSEIWPRSVYKTKDRVLTSSRDFVLSLSDDDYKYFENYKRDGFYVFPEAALLTVVWETFAMFIGEDYRTMSVNFSDVQFYEEVEIRPNDLLKLGIMINKGNNYFEVIDNFTTVATGYISEIKEKFKRQLEKPDVNNNITMNTQEIYHYLRMKGYSYEGKFQSIHSVTSNCSTANIKYTDEWIPLIDSLLQIAVIKREYAGLSKLKQINKLVIDTICHKNAVQKDIDGVTCLSAEYYDVHDITRCGGVEISSTSYVDMPIVELSEPDILQTRCFVPHFLLEKIDLKSALLVNMQIVADNTMHRQIKVMKLFSTDYPEFSNVLKEVTDEIPYKDFILNGSTKDTVDTTTVFIVDNLLENIHKIEAISRSSLKSNFILAVEKGTKKILPKYELFNVITSMEVNNNTLVLVNTVNSSNSENITYLPIVNDNEFTWIPRVQLELDMSRKLILVSNKQPTNSGVLGIVKKLKEKYGNKIGLIIIEDHHVENFNLESKIFKNQLLKQLSINVLKNGHWGGYYNVPSAKDTNIRNVTLTSTVTSDLDSLKWVELPEMPASKTTVQVFYAGLSSEDAHSAAGTALIPNKGFGKEFSGIDVNGQRMMGLLPEGALSSIVQADPALLWPVPEHWSLEDAATVPLAYVQAYYCLIYFMEGKAYFGRSVFINGAAEPFGQAILSLVLSMGYEIYASVDDMAKKKLLLEIFPQLDEKNVVCSRTEFHPTVIRNTNGRGCSIVINSTGGESRHSAMKTTRSHGFFLDVCEEDMRHNEDFGMSFLSFGKNYKSIRFSSIFKPEFVKEKMRMQHLVAEGIALGVVRPLIRRVYSTAEVTKAFRVLSLEKYNGKVLIRMKDPQVSNEVMHVPRLTYSSEGTYIVVCDENVLGIEVADRLVQQGARNLVLHRKPNSFAGYCYTKFESWKKLNVSVKIFSENLTESECVNLLKEGTKLAPVVGIFVIQNFNTEPKEEALESKSMIQKFNKSIRIVANLDVSSRKLCSDLKHFAVLNYSPKSASDEYAVSMIERICEARSEACLPALAIRIPSISEFDNKSKSETIIRSQKLTTVMNALETSLKLNYTNVLTFDLKKEINYNFLIKIARIVGLSHIDDIRQDITLGELCLNESNLQEIKILIKKVYGMHFGIKRVEKLDIASLKNFSKIQKIENTKFNAGLGAFYTYVDDDECMATEPMIHMPTKLSNGLEEEQELDPKTTYLMLIPGFEGHHQIFKCVSERLKVHAMTFQLGPDMDDDNVQKMAINILKFIKKRFKLKSNFYLLGYSFGVNVALELAALLEKEGRVGTVYCLDSSPDALRIQLDAYIGNLSDTELQNSIVEHMYRLMTGTDSEALKKDLQKSENWPEKVEACVIRLRKLVSYSNELKRSILETAYRRIMLARQYEPDFKLESELILIKGIPHPRAKALADDYNLSKYTTKPVKVLHIDSDHASAPYDCRLSNIVNKFLGPELLSRYEQEILCDTYLIEDTKQF